MDFNFFGRRPRSAEVSEQRPFRRRGRIVLSLLAVLVIVGLAPLATVAWKLIDINREALTRAQQEYQLLLASSIGREVDSQMGSMRSQVVRLARALGPAAARRSSIDEHEFRRTLAEIADDRMLYLRYDPLRGNVVESAPPGDLGDDVLETIGHAAERTAEAYAATDGNPNLVVLSRPFLLHSVDSRAVLVMSTPVVSRARVRGVLSALIDLQGVWDSLISNQHSGHTLFLLDDRGRSFLTTDAERVPAGQGFTELPIVQRFLSASGRASETMPFVWDAAGEEDNRYIGSYGMTEQQWGVFVLAREQQVYLPVRDMIGSTLSWAVLALALAILAAVVFAGTLSTPINRLAAASRAFAAGDLSRRVEVSSTNEIGELAHGFNQMAAQIEANIRELKRAAEENNQLFLGTIRALAQAIDAKDPYTRGHSARVNAYSMIIAEELGMPEEEQRDIYVASLLHDVGKIGVDDAILKKPGALTAEEFAIMKTHTVLGAGIMSRIPQMRRILPGLRSHHERMNGGGYPDGLGGDEIPLMARIIAVADTFDAMTTHRPYQSAMTFEQAAKRINELQTVALDTEVVDAFNRAYGSGKMGDRPIEVDEEIAEAPRAASA